MIYPSLTAQMCSLSETRIRGQSRRSQFARHARACLLTTRDRDHALRHGQKDRNEQPTPLYSLHVAGRRPIQPFAVGNGTRSARFFRRSELVRYAQELGEAESLFSKTPFPFLKDDGGDLRGRMTPCPNALFGTCKMKASFLFHRASGSRKPSAFDLCRSVCASGSPLSTF